VSRCLSTRHSWRCCSTPPDPLVGLPGTPPHLGWCTAPAGASHPVHRLRRTRSTPRSPTHRCARIDTSPKPSAWARGILRRHVAMGKTPRARGCPGPGRQWRSMGTKRPNSSRNRWLGRCTVLCLAAWVPVSNLLHWCHCKRCSWSGCQVRKCCCKGPTHPAATGSQPDYGSSGVRSGPLPDKAKHLPPDTAQCEPASPRRKWRCKAPKSPPARHSCCCQSTSCFPKAAPRRDSRFLGRCCT